MIYITGTRRGIGKALEDKYGNVEALEHCDVFINCKHDGFDQVRLLYKAANLGKRIINVGSLSIDYIDKIGLYAVEKKALQAANHDLFTKGHNTTCVNFGYVDTERIAHKNVEKMSVQYCIEVIDWIIQQPHRVKEISVSI